jgi:hypothetical protein
MKRLFYYHFLLTFIFYSSPSFSQDNFLNKKPYRVFIKAGSFLTDLKTDKDFILEKGMYALVLENNSAKRDKFLVYDKSEKPIYETSALSILEIEDEIRLLPNHRADVTYPAQSTLKSYNTYAFLDTQVNFHIDQLSTSPLDPIYKQNLQSALSNRIELRTVYSSELPVNFGLALNFQSAYWQNEFQDINLTILSFGPHFQRYIYEVNDFAVSLHLGAEYAPYYRSTANINTDDFNAVIFNFGAETLWNTKHGKWTFGAHYRRHDATLKSSNRLDINETPREIIIHSLGIMIGYKYEWNL